MEAYESLGWGIGKTVWIEADPELAGRLCRRLAALENHEVIQAVAWHRTGAEIDFTRTSNSEASSALQPAELLHRYPEIREIGRSRMKTTALADLEQIRRLPEIGLLNLDIQGAELHALRGLKSQIRKCASVYTEVNYEELYAGAATCDEVAMFLHSVGFVLVDEQDSGRGWGDQFWVRHDLAPKWRTVRRVIRRIDSRVRQYGNQLRRRSVAVSSRTHWPRS